MWRVACVRFCTYDVLPARGRGQGAGPAVGRALRSVTVRVAQSTVLGGVHLSSPSPVIRVIRVTLVVVLYRELDGSGVRPYVVSTRYCRQSVKGRIVYLPDTGYPMRPAPERTPMLPMTARRDAYLKVAVPSYTFYRTAYHL